MHEDVQVAFTAQEVFGGALDAGEVGEIELQDLEPAGAAGHGGLDVLVGFVELVAGSPASESTISLDVLR